MVETREWTIETELKTAEDIAYYLEAVFEEGDEQYIPRAIGNVARSVGMAEIAEKTGLSRQSLYRALGENGDPLFSTVVKVMKAIGLDLRVVEKPAVVKKVPAKKTASVKKPPAKDLGVTRVRPYKKGSVPEIVAPKKRTRKAA